MRESCVGGLCAFYFLRERERERERYPYASEFYCDAHSKSGQDYVRKWTYYILSNQSEVSKVCNVPTCMYE